MREKPILFSGPMVQAILDGRKTMTRRVVKVDDPDNWKVSIAGTSIVRAFPYDVRLSRYEVGDILRVRETWARLNDDYHPDDKGSIYVYKADHITGNDGPDLIKWKPSIFMPRAAARIWLEVVNVRVERLQDITEDDAVQEGFEGVRCDHPGGRWACEDCMNTGWREPPRVGFIETWQALNAKRGYGWDTNPWVFVVEFKHLEGER